MNEEEQLEMWEQPKEELSIEAMDAAVVKLRKARDEYAELSRVAKESHEVVKELEYQVISMLTKAGKKKYIVEGVGNITLTETLSVQTPKSPQEKEAFFNWLKEEMGQDGFLAYASVNSSSLNKLYKDKFEEYAARGEVLEIEGLQQPVSYTKLSLRKA